MWEFEEVQRAGTTILIFYFIDDDSDKVQHDKTIYTRGQITCHDQAEVELWRTVLTTLNSTKE